MNEQALYRKYRPTSFSDVLGQDDVVTTLLREIEVKKISHAYLFSGGRGTGKTTVARIFAAAIGCAPVDLYEIDGASNRQIEDVRALREAVLTLPFVSPYKVYIIDEVHMLTKEAFNALLKTLEEPPAHVVFILATTDKEKLPDTIVSRCQTFSFRQPSLDELKKFVLATATKEQIALDGGGADIIAMFGDGSYRDTLSVLEKVLVRSGSKALSNDEIARIVGAPTHDLVNRVLRAVETGELADGLSAIRTASADHVDAKAYLKLILQKLRAVLLLRYDPKAEALFRNEFTAGDIEFLLELARSETRRVNSRALNAFLDAAREAGFGTIPMLPIELALLRAGGAETQVS